MTPEQLVAWLKRELWHATRNELALEEASDWSAGRYWGRGNTLGQVLQKMGIDPQSIIDDATFNRNEPPMPIYNEDGTLIGMRQNITFPVNYAKSRWVACNSTSISPTWEQVKRLREQHRGIKEGTACPSDPDAKPSAHVWDTEQGYGLCQCGAYTRS